MVNSGNEAYEARKRLKIRAKKSDREESDNNKSEDKIVIETR